MLTEKEKWSVLDRMSDKFLVGDGCWEWQGASVHGGYGQIRVYSKNRVAHRVMYELMVGPIPEGLFLDHLCCNPPCIRPDHLEPVTQAENLIRANIYYGTNVQHGLSMYVNHKCRCDVCYRANSEYRARKKAEKRLK